MTGKKDRLKDVTKALQDNWELLDRLEQEEAAAKQERARLIGQAFDLGADYLRVMACTGLPRVSVWRIRKAIQDGQQDQKEENAQSSWDYTVHGRKHRTAVPQEILEETLRDDYLGRLEALAGDDDSLLALDFDSQDLGPAQARLRDAIHRLAVTAGQATTPTVTSDDLDLTLTRHQDQPVID